MNRVALIAGGARGIGRACALDLAAHDWQVGVACRTRSADALTLGTQLERLQRNSRVDVCDLEDHDAMVKWVDTCERALGPIDALVYTAGPFYRMQFDANPDDTWRKCFEGNLHAPRSTAIKALAEMRKRHWGRVVLFGMASSSRLAPPPTLAAYHAAKAALTAWARAAAVSVASDGVTVNVIAPGVIDTGSIDASVVATVVSKVPAGRAGAASEVSALVRFLLSDEAGYINGAELTVSGAWGY